MKKFAKVTSIILLLLILAVAAQAILEIMLFRKTKYDTKSIRARTIIFGKIIKKGNLIYDTLFEVKYYGGVIKSLTDKTIQIEVEGRILTLNLSGNVTFLRSVPGQKSWKPTVPIRSDVGKKVTYVKGGIALTGKDAIIIMDKDK